MKTYPTKYCLIGKTNKSRIIVLKNQTLQDEYLNVYEAEEHGLQKGWIARTKQQEQKQMTVTDI
jgi:hypothetical protein